MVAIARHRLEVHCGLPGSRRPDDEYHGARRHRAGRIILILLVRAGRPHLAHVDRRGHALDSERPVGGASPRRKLDRVLLPDPKDDRLIGHGLIVEPGPEPYPEGVDDFEALDDRRARPRGPRTPGYRLRGRVR